jgi:hypothetical protein
VGNPTSASAAIRAIMIVFSAAKMRHMGYDDPRFVA